MVVRQTAAVLASGFVIGLLGTLATNRLLASVLPGARQEGHDIASALFACAVILIVALVSTFVPALRAARLDPKAALQAD
jgi:ABC-type antimicrobial peptide transport system permease subunit